MDIVGFVLFCGILHLAMSVNPSMYMTQTKTTIVDKYQTLVVEKDKDAFLACVVDNKPLQLPVQWYTHNFASNTTLDVSTDTETFNSFKYQLDKPANNNWRLTIQNVQQSDEALYVYRIQPNERYQRLQVLTIFVVM